MRQLAAAFMCLSINRLRLKAQASLRTPRNLQLTLNWPTTGHLAGSATASAGRPYTYFNGSSRLEFE
jgi:hypothetical protein